MVGRETWKGEKTWIEGDGGEAGGKERKHEENGVGDAERAEKDRRESGGEVPG